jgi:hypothetical protein
VPPITGPVSLGLGGWALLLSLLALPLPLFSAPAVDGGGGAPLLAAAAGGWPD